MPHLQLPRHDEPAVARPGAGGRDPLLAAVMAMAADLDLDLVLRRFVQAAAELTGARYAALGVLAEGGPARLSSFVHLGMTDAEVAVTGRLPEGHGILGLLVDDPAPLRLPDLGRHPLAVGFPPGHPPMRSFLGVPVRSRDRVFGNLYLTEKPAGDFTQEDQDLVVALASAAGVLIENARLHDQALRRERWLEATALVVGELTRATSGRDALALVADQACAAAEADAAWVVTDREGVLEVQAVAGAAASVRGADDAPLLPAPTADAVGAGRTVVTHAVVAAGGVAGPDAGVVLGPGVVVPLRTDEGVVGALALGWSGSHEEAFHRLDIRLPESFAAHAALALQLLRSRAAERRLDLLEERDRIGRDLHDLVVQRIFAVGLGLESLRRRTHDPDTQGRAAVAVRELDETVREIRRTIFALGSGVAGADLQTEVARVVERAASTLKFRPHLDLRGPVRSAVDDETGAHLLAVLAETLSNSARHAAATRVDVTLEVGAEVTLTVADDGRGLPPDVRESGLANVRDRAARLGGRCDVTSSDHGTTVRWSVPLVRRG